MKLAVDAAARLGMRANRMQRYEFFRMVQDNQYNAFLGLERIKEATLLEHTLSGSLRVERRLFRRLLRNQSKSDDRSGLNPGSRFACLRESYLFTWNLVTPFLMKSTIWWAAARPALMLASAVSAPIFLGVEK